MPSSHRAAVTSLLWWMSRCACARQMTYLKTGCCWLFHEIQYKGLCALVKFTQVFNLPWSGWEVSQMACLPALTYLSPRSRQVEHLCKFHQGTTPLILNFMKKSTTSCLEVCHLPSTSTSGHSSQQAGHCSSVATGHDVNSPQRLVEFSAYLSLLIHTSPVLWRNLRTLTNMPSLFAACTCHLLFWHWIYSSISSSTDCKCCDTLPR